MNFQRYNTRRTTRSLRLRRNARYQSVRIKQEQDDYDWTIEPDETLEINLDDCKSKKCFLCAANFKSTSSLKQHFHRKHAKISDSCKDETDDDINDDKNEDMNEDGASEGKWYKCPACFAYFNSAINLKRHFSHTHPEEEELDDSYFDNQDFETINEIIASNKLDSNLKKFFKCPFCPSIFKQNAYLRKHSITTHPEKSKVIKKLKKVPKVKKVDANLPEDENEDGKWYKCPVCCAYFSSLRNLKRHYSHTHPDESDLDMTTFDSQDSEAITKLMESRKFDTNVTKFFKCSYCPAVFKQNAYLKRHCMCIHPEKSSSLKDSLNPDIISNDEDIELHKEVIKWFKCSLCPVYLNSEKLIKRHFRHFHPKENELDYPCFEEQDMEMIRSCLGTNDLDPNITKFFKCLFCSLLFKHYEDLKTHVMCIHPTKSLSSLTYESIDEDSSDVEIKDAFISNKTDVNDQNKSNVKDKWSKCPACPSYFNSAINLKRHFTRTHPEEKELDITFFNNQDSKMISDIIDVKNLDTNMTKFFKCPYCPQIFKQNAYLKKHCLCLHPDVDHIGNRKDLKCPCCPALFNAIEGLKIHYSRKHSEFGELNYLINENTLSLPNPNQIFQCPSCPETYNQLSGLKNHLEKNHPERADLLETDFFKNDDEISDSEEVNKDGNQNENELNKNGDKYLFKCPYCNTYFRFESEIKRHILTNHRTKKSNINLQKVSYVSENDNQRKKWFFCSHCPSIFKTYPNFKKHMIMTHRKLPNVRHRFTNKHVLKKHNLNKPKPKLKAIDRPYACSMCEKAYTTNALRVKCEKTHLGKKDLECLHCDAVFTTKLELKKHSTQAHGEGVVRINKTCPVCGKKFIYAHAYKAHAEYHRYYCRDEVSVCTKCVPERTFTNYRVYYNHMRGHAGFQCNINLCGKKYNSSTSLKLHRLRDHGGTPSYKCNLCSKLYYIKNGLTRHERQVHKINYTERKEMEFQDTLRQLHSEEVKTDHDYMCDHCGEGFSDVSKLVIHKRYHQEEKTFSCQFCDKVFLIEAGLKHHISFDHHLPQFFNPADV